MTDGHTGIQVAPITEDDMSRVTDILKRAADAIVGMSQLKADVDMLQATVKGLQADTDRLRNQNAALDEALAHVRSERDIARSESHNWQSRANEAETARDSLRNQVNDLGFEKASLESKLAQAISDRDNEGFRVMELEEELKETRNKLGALRQTFETVFGKTIPTLVEQSQAMQSVAEMPSLPPTPEPLAPGVVKTTQEPYTPPPYEPYAPTPTADEAHKPQAPARTYYGNVWAPGHIWDSVKGEYYTEV